MALVSVGTATTIALTSATPAIAANQALMLNGIGGAGLPDLVMSQVLAGAFGNYNRVNVDWPMQAAPVTGEDDLTLTESVAVGVDNLNAAITLALTKIGPNEHVTVVGLSAGALVADDVLRELLTDPNAPDKSKLTFVVVADSSRANFNSNRFDSTLGYQYRLPVATKYDTTVVTAEYDGFADFPDRVWNVLAVINAFAGEITKHVPSVFTDLSKVDPSNITVNTNSLGGVTTNYFIPSEHLPLVELLPFLAPQEAALKAIIDTAYKRNDGKSAAATPAAAVANTAPAAPTAAVASTTAALDKNSSVITPAESVAVKEQVEAVDPAPAQAPTTGDSRSSTVDAPATEAVAEAVESAPTVAATTTGDAPQKSARHAGTSRASDGSGTAGRPGAHNPRAAAATRANKR